MDVSGIQKVPGGGYVTLPDGYGYFANLEDRDCGVPILREVGVVRSGAKILIADEIDSLLREREMELELEAIAGYGETEAQEILKAAREMALWKGYTLEEIIGAIMNAVAVGANPKKGRRTFADFKTAWDRKEARGKLRAVERENVSRFRQRKARESTWAVQKRTGQRKREWRGPWRETKRTN